MKFAMKHKETGVVKNVKYGFSWTNLFFGVFAPLFRGDFKWFILQLMADILTGGIAIFIFPFFYNRMYIKDLIEKGYVPATESSLNFLKDKGVM